MNRYIGWPIHDSRDLELRSPLVINPIHLPSSIAFVTPNQFTTLQLQIPFGARPGIFVPPISGKKIGPLCSIDVALNFRDCEDELAYLHPARRKPTRPVETGAKLQRAQSPGMRGPSGICQPLCRWGQLTLQRTKMARIRNSIRPMRVFQNWCADPVGAQKSGQTGERF